MQRWVLSRYSCLVELGGGDLALHNSFMGAVARIPAALRQRLVSAADTGICDSDLGNVHLRELCANGFFVAAGADETKEVRAILEREREAVMSLVVLPHEGCNFRCLYCYERFEHGRMSPQLMCGLARFVTETLPHYEELRVSWFGGEPLLALRELCQLSDSFLDTCAAAGKRYSSSITTNGYLLSPSVVDALISRNVRAFQVTLDGPQRVHDGQRRLVGGQGTHGRIMSNLLKLRDRPDAFLVRVRVNVLKSTVDAVRRWLGEEFQPLFGQDSRFTVAPELVERWGGPNDACLDICGDHLRGQARTGLLEAAAGLGVGHEECRRALMPHGCVCYAARASALVVRADGTLCKCTVALANPGNVVGRLDGEGRARMDASAMRRWTTVEGDEASGCDACSFYPSCQARKCPLATMTRHRPVCPMTRPEYETMVRAVALAGPGGKPVVGHPGGGGGGMPDHAPIREEASA